MKHSFNFFNLIIVFRYYTVEPLYNEDLGTMKFESYLVITGFCYIRPLYNEVSL